MAVSNTPAGPNPFFTNPPIVLVVRHVRVTGSGEVVAEDANDLHRYTYRSFNTRVFPQRLATQAAQRDIPNVGQQKISF